MRTNRVRDLLSSVPSLKSFLAFYQSLPNFTFLKTAYQRANLREANMVDVVQLVRMLDCDSGGRGFEPRHSPQILKALLGLFYILPT